MVLRRDYTIKEVDTAEEENAEIIREFNRAEAAWPKLSDEDLEGFNCFWWLAYRDREPVAMAGLVPSILYKNAGYLKRVFVMPDDRGHGLQLRFWRLMEKKARKIGWNLLVSETTNTVYSANNFIKNGYLLFDPAIRWAFNESLYWRKDL